MDGGNKESVYGRFGMSVKGEGMNCGVVEVVKRNTLKWFGHLKRMGESEMTRRIYKGGVDAVGVRGRLPCKMGGQIAGVQEGEGG